MSIYCLTIVLLITLSDAHPTMSDTVQQQCITYIRNEQFILCTHTQDYRAVHAHVTTQIGLLTHRCLITSVHRVLQRFMFRGRCNFYRQRVAEPQVHKCKSNIRHFSRNWAISAQFLSF